MRNLYSTAAAAVIAITMAPAALAAESSKDQKPSVSAEADAPNDEIIVTAQRRAENIQDVPIAINALTSAQMKERQIESVADLAATIPGIKFAEFSGAGNVYIRGVGTSIVSGAGESSVAAHIDGIYIGVAQATTMVQDDLGRIEVLRGPQGTLYGRNSTGGVINYISADPTKEFAASISALYGNYDRKQVQGYISGPLSDNVRIRLYGKYQDRDGYILNTITGQRLDNIKQGAGRVSIEADLTPNWTSKLRVTADHENIAGPVFDAFVTAPPPLLTGSNLDPRKVNSPTISSGFKEIWVGSFKNEFKLGGLKLTSLSGLVDFTFNSHYDGVASPTPATITRNAHSRDYSQEFNLSGSADKLDFMVGLYYYRSDKNVTSVTDYHLIPIFALRPNGVITQSSQQRSYSAFGDLTLHVSDRFRLFGGARYSIERLDQSLDSRSGAAISCSGANIQRYRGEAISGRFGAQADVSQDVMVYGQFSHGFKPGGFSSSQCNNAYAAETINAVEGGVKSTLANGLGTLNASAYYYDYTNLQLEQVVLGGIPVSVAPKSRIFGAEVAASLNISKALRLDLSGAYNNATYRQFINNDKSLGGAAGTNLAGFPLNNSPKFSGAAALENTFELGDAASLKIRGEVNYSSSYFVRETNNPLLNVGPYALVNAFATLGFDNDRYTIRVFGKNLTNRTILAGVIGFGGLLGTFQPPRTYGVEATVRF